MHQIQFLLSVSLYLQMEFDTFWAPTALTIAQLGDIPPKLATQPCCNAMRAGVDGGISCRQPFWTPPVCMVSHA